MLNSGSKFDIMNPIFKEIVMPKDDDPYDLGGMMTDEEPEEFFASYQIEPSHHSRELKFFEKKSK